MADKFNLLELFKSATTVIANEQPQTDVAKIYAHAFAHATQKIAEALNGTNALAAALRTKARKLNDLADLVDEVMASEMPMHEGDGAKDKDDKKPEGEQKKPETEGTQTQPPAPPEPPKS